MTAVNRGAFRADLYHRLRGHQVLIPALADRADDVALLIEHFLGPSAVSDPALTLLQRYPWPGNVRELRTVLALAQDSASGGQICPEHLPEEVRNLQSPEYVPAPERPGEPETLQALTERHVRRALAYTRGNKARAARILGIDVKTLRRHLGRQTPEQRSQSRG